MRAIVPVAAAVSLLLASGEGMAQDHPSALMREAWIKAAWTKAVAGQAFERSERWIPAMGGVGSAPSNEAGRTIGNLCQPHNCDDNKLVVIVDRANRRVYGLQIRKNPAKTRLFGDPNEAMRRALAAAAR